MFAGTAHSRLRTVAATALTCTLTAGAAALLTGCDPADTAKAAPSSPAAVTATAGSTPAGRTTTSAAPTTAKTSAAPPPAVNGTAHSALTISNGTQSVLMNGTSVDFGTVVRDLAWSPNGAKAAFINGSGDLVVANPDGSGRVVVAKNPGGQTWSHPAWQVAAADTRYKLPAKNNLFFAAAKNGVSRLESVPANGVNSTPSVISLETESGDAPALPQTGNVWPNGGDPHGAAVYANSDTGDVYIRDDYLRQQGFMLTQGSQPALAPDTREIAFVRSVAGHDHIFRESFDRSTPKDLTPNATTDYTEPAWSPDGRTIAARTPTGVATLPADGSAAPTQVSTVPGLPAYRGHS